MWKLHIVVEFAVCSRKLHIWCSLLYLLNDYGIFFKIVYFYDETKILAPELIFFHVKNGYFRVVFVILLDDLPIQLPIIQGLRV